MAEIEIAPLSDRLSDEEIVQLTQSLQKLGAPPLPKSDDGNSLTVEDSLDDDVLTEFFDHLDAHDIAAEIYLPAEFEGRVEVSRFRVGSLVALLEALDEIKDELAVGQEEEEEEDEDDESDEDEETEEQELELIGNQLRRCWVLFQEGARAASERKLPLHIAF